MRTSIDQIEAGLNADTVNLTLPDGVFSDVRNVRFRNGAVEKCKGQSAVFGSLSVTPMWAASIGDGITSYWVYANEGTIYATDGTTHSNISSVSYNAGPDLGYTGGQYHGYQILNDSITVPQTWSPGLANKAQPLTNWPGTLLCKVIRPFKDFLVALRCTESSVYNPRLIRWSDAAGAGNLPGSWDYTDPTNLSGRTELGETQDYLVDCLTLRDANIVYKGFSTWLMQPIQTSDVFLFRQILSQSGLLAEGCVRAFNGHHFVVTADDIIVHDGANAQSVAERRVKKWFFNTLSSSTYLRTFVVADYLNHTMWICFPEVGNTFPDLALCWDWVRDNWFVRELNQNMAAGEVGVVIGSNLTFDGQSGSFDSQTVTFDDQTFTPFSNRLVLFNGAAPAAYQAESGETFNGTTMTSYATRTNMALTKDVLSVKKVQRVYPKIIGTAGDTFQIYIGTASTPDGTVTFSGPYNFTIGTDFKVEVRPISARWITIKVQGQTSNSWQLAGFDIEFQHDGYR